MIGGTTPPDIRRVLATLHAKKSAAYGSAWQKRGECLSIFPNVARKYDRLEVAVGAGELDRMADDSCSCTVEPLLDTVADLVVYAVKYLMFLAETDAACFPEDVARFAAFEQGLAAIAARAPTGAAAGDGLHDSLARLAAGMQAIECLLQTAGAQSLEVRFEKARAVVALAVAGWELLVGIAARSPRRWTDFAGGVAAL